MNTQQSEKQIDEYVDMIDTLTQQYFQKHYPSLVPHEYSVDWGRKYHRVVQQDAGSGHHRSVHSFVDNEGNVYKAAGWKAPAKGVRYRLPQDMDTIRAKFDPHGSYLYKTLSDRDRSLSSR